MPASIGVVGAGAWGTALAQTMAQAGHDVSLWAHEPKTAQAINASRCNAKYLPDIPLDARISATGDLSDLSTSDIVLLVPPAQHMREIVARLRPSLTAPTPLVICSKGIERTSRASMTDAVRDAAPDNPVAVLSGPSFAIDVVRGRPAALTLACSDAALGEQLAATLGHRDFRLYWTDDVTGVQLGGAVKNVLAIAAGIVAGKDLGASAHAALVTRGFAELQRLGVALGARPETLMGLSGLGDLILTCGSPVSRNMSLGKALGEGRTLDEILGARASVTEGVFTTDAVVAIAQEKQIDMPIARGVQAILNGQLTVDGAIDALLARPMKPERTTADKTT